MSYGYAPSYWETYCRRLELQARGKRLNRSMVPHLDVRVRFLDYVLTDLELGEV